MKVWSKQKLAMVMECNSRIVAYTDITDYLHMHTQLQRFRTSTEFLSRLAIRHSWYEQAHCSVLYRAVQKGGDVCSLPPPLSS